MNGYIVLYNYVQKIINKFDILITVFMLLIGISDFSCFR